jgi:ACS family D-galactonate transporter-like MFS transporter
MLTLVSINYIDRASLSVAMPLIGEEFDLDPATQGLILSSFFWTYAFMQVPGGMLADRYKPRIVIALSTVGWGFFQTIAAVSTSSTMLLLTRLGLGLTEAPIYPAGGKLNAMWMTPNERARGATLLDGGAPLGAALGAVVIAGLIAGLGSLAARVPGCRLRHHGVRTAGLVVYPQQPARASDGERCRGPPH